MLVYQPPKLLAEQKQYGEDDDEALLAAVEAVEAAAAGAGGGAGTSGSQGAPSGRPGEHPCARQSRAGGREGEVQAGQGQAG